MLRRTPLRRTAFKARQKHEPAVAREPRPMAPLRPVERAGVYSGGTSGVAVEKGEKAKPGKRPPNARERAWMDAIVAYGCVACRIDGLGIVPPAVHHILRGGVRMGHLFTLPLCHPGHHQHGDQAGKVSRHPWKARFEQLYGDELHLLERLRAEIGVPK